MRKSLWEWSTFLAGALLECPLPATDTYATPCRSTTARAERHRKNSIDARSRFFLISRDARMDCYVTCAADCESVIFSGPPRRVGRRGGPGLGAAALFGFRSFSLSFLPSSSNHGIRTAAITVIILARSCLAFGRTIRGTRAALTCSFAAHSPRRTGDVLTGWSVLRASVEATSARGGDARVLVAHGRGGVECCHRGAVVSLGTRLRLRGACAWQRERELTKRHFRCFGSPVGWGRSRRNCPKR